MLRRVRIPVQLAVLALFVYLLARTVGVGNDELGRPVRIFLEIDPLIGLTTWMRTGLLPGLLWLSGVTVLLTFVLGRFFCGWVCPLGTLSQIAGRLGRSRRDERSADHHRPDQWWKFGLLLFLLGGAATGALWTGLLDPICLLIRGLAVGLVPPLEAATRGAAGALAGTFLAPITEPIYRAVRDGLLAPRPPQIEQGTLLLALLIGLLALSWVRRRFWCRVLCPLGALLGAVAWSGMLRLRQDGGKCTSCELCTYHCQGAADPQEIGGWRASECLVCGNCTASCRQSGLRFALEPPRFWSALRSPMRFRPARRAGSKTDRTRRGLLASLACGLLSGSAALSSPSAKRPAGSLIRPPGARIEEEFLDRCVRCGECMKVCPQVGLHPAGFESGLAGLWTPVLRPRIGYCEYQCTLCGQACPTGAIRHLSLAEKRAEVIGLAWFDTDRCLPYAYATACIVCEEHCPTSPKAITLTETSVISATGTVHTVRQPKIDPKVCVGCGICEYVCPVDGTAAVRVEGAGRTEKTGAFNGAYSS